MIKNTDNQYGTLSKFFHWGIVIFFLVQYYLVYWKIYFLPEKSPIANFYINTLHKPIGITAFVFALLAIVWRLMNVKPGFPPAMNSWEKISARFVHLLLYLTMLIMPLSGLLMTIAAGHPPNYFGLFQVPTLFEPNKELSQFFFGIHKTTGFIIIALVAVHTLAALKHQFINRDFVLKRML